VTRRRKSTAFFAAAGALLLLTGGMFLHAGRAERASAGYRSRTAAMVRELGLTDLCLFPEANYTRHLSQADVHTAFQDAPGGLEHFPSGSLTEPPARIKERSRADLD
jgi:hypothetical protein